MTQAFGPHITELISLGEIEKAAELILKVKEEQESRAREMAQLEQTLMLDPFNIDAQKKLEELIREVWLTL